MKDMEGKFPRGFCFGAATAAHQVEGNTRNDWTLWEKKNAARLAAEAALRPIPPTQGRPEEFEGRHAPASDTSTAGRQGKWPDYLLTKPPTPLEETNYLSGTATDHYHRYEEDFDMAEALGHNAHRFSLEWSRIEPKEEVWDEGEIAHYQNVIRALRTRGLEPFVTLWHFTLPLWLTEKGGVCAPHFPEYFARYARRAAEILQKEGVRFVITINEPKIYALNSYWRSIWPPQERSTFSFFRARAAMIRAHRAAYDAVKKTAKGIQVGIACNLSYFESGGGIVNDIAASLANWFWNNSILRRVQGSLDFIGLNYYFHNRIRYGFNKNENMITSDLGWELYPPGIAHVLRDLQRYDLPIYVTENGLADARDLHREWFIEETLQAILDVIRDGVDVRGYFHWSLLDNFEWDKGFWPRFGLIDVEHPTLRRTIRGSAHAYASLIRKHSTQ